MITPADPEKVLQLAFTGTPVEAVLAAWNEPGPHRIWHSAAKLSVRNSMPVLAVALDRLSDELTPPADRHPGRECNAVRTGPDESWHCQKHDADHDELGCPYDEKRKG